MIGRGRSDDSWRGKMSVLSAFDGAAARGSDAYVPTSTGVRYNEEGKVREGRKVEPGR